MTALKEELRPKRDYLNGYFTSNRKYALAPAEKRTEIERRIDALEDEDEKVVLKKRYIERLNWIQIELYMHVSRATVFRIHAKALEHLDISVGGE